MSALFDELNIELTLRERINEIKSSKQRPNVNGKFILYLPTVVLRKKHNPAFAFACHLSNNFNVPVVVLAVVLDDFFLPQKGHKPIVFTARRIAFVLEALQSAAREWSDHGAGVAIRVHGHQARTPHQLTLACKAVAVVTDEPFVHPYVGFVQSVERAASAATVPVYRVDGSTTVPPRSKLQMQKTADGKVTWRGVPAKAWMWEKQTSSKRKGQIYGAVKGGHLDAPALENKLGPTFFFDGSAIDFPTEWRFVKTPSPNRRPWTVEEICEVSDMKAWVLGWDSIDPTVPPCRQTHGSTQAGEQRWKVFKHYHLSSYAKLRNSITKPHAVSRMSCYLNYGIVSIFQIIFELWQMQKCGGVSKFEEEIIKWREIGYVHSFSIPDYNRAAVVPAWAKRYLEGCRKAMATGPSYSVESLEEARTDDDTWNAMQQYLTSTGELHNNARMTWGKTMVHWQKYQHSLDDLLHQMVYINDRYALDGLSPPSYAGLLWCLGWCDKPKDVSGTLSEKSASRYRASASSFVDAERALLETKSHPSVIGAFQNGVKRKRHGESEVQGGGVAAPNCIATTSPGRSVSKPGTILLYFGPKEDSGARLNTIG